MAHKLNTDRRRFLGAMGRVVTMAPFGLADLSSYTRLATALQPVSMELSSLDRASEWLNSPPLKAAGLRGKVVLVNFWTYSCINWIRTAPYLRAWAEQYREQGLVVVGVHSPEFPFEHTLDNVRRAVKEMHIEYPVAIDNDFAIWRAFNNQYWPAAYLSDGQGRIRHRQFGEGKYDQLEQVIQQLLQEAGGNRAGQTPAMVEAQGVEAPADWRSLQSPENYVGYARTEHFASPGGIKSGIAHAYNAPNNLTLNQWALSGNWTVEKGAVKLNDAKGSIKYRFHARDLHLVMGAATPGKPVRFRVRIDGEAPGAGHGRDVDAQGNGTATYPRLYQLIRQSGPVADHQFEVEFLDGGVEAFAFTFG